MSDECFWGDHQDCAEESCRCPCHVRHEWTDDPDEDDSSEGEGEGEGERLPETEYLSFWEQLPNGWSSVVSPLKP